MPSSQTVIWKICGAESLSRVIHSRGKGQVTAFESHAPGPLALLPGSSSHAPGPWLWPLAQTGPLAQPAWLLSLPLSKAKCQVYGPGWQRNAEMRSYWCQLVRSHKDIFLCLVFMRSQDSIRGGRSVSLEDSSPTAGWLCYTDR